jgi:two-component system chemotaxis response regulator CheB
MIIFCEECGARNNVSSDSLDANLHTFECCQCGQVLMVSKPTMGSGGFHAFSKMEPECQIKQADTPITVLLVDDSTVLRKIIKDMFASDDRLQVVGEAEHGLKALELIPQLKPDVVTLDVNMPVMDGMTAIKHIMIKCPTPVVMFSTLTGQGSLETFETLRYGAVDFLQKPSSLLEEDLKSQHELIISRVKNAARAGIDTVRYLRPAQVAPKSSPKHRIARLPPGLRHRQFLWRIRVFAGIDPRTRTRMWRRRTCAFYMRRHPHVDAFANGILMHHSPLGRYVVPPTVQTLCPGTCYLASVFETRCR